MNSNNKKLAKNIFLMFLIYFLPKVFSFFLVPIYTKYLTTSEYGISDLIVTTSSLIAPFISLATPNAILRFTIENKEDKRPLQISYKVYFRGMLVLLLGLNAVYFLGQIEISYLFFTYLLVGTSVLADMSLAYLRGLEKMKALTICGVGSSFVGILCNILFIVVFKFGLYGFLLSASVGYIFTILVANISYRKNRVFVGFSQKDKVFGEEVLKFSVPLVFSGLSWWVISSSDRYFVSWMLGTVANGLYSVAYKIPTILQALHCVFSQAWLYTLYDSYKTDEGKQYISKAYDVYVFVICAGCSFLIGINIFLAHFLFSNDFFEAWRYVPLLLLSVVFTCASDLMSGFLAIYKKSKISMNISTVAAVTNIVLNGLFIEVLNDAMGAAIATDITFFVSYVLTVNVTIKLSGMKINLRRHLFMFGILTVQAVILVLTQNYFLCLFGLVLILILNIETLMWAKDKWKNLLRPQNKLN